LCRMLPSGSPTAMYFSLNQGLQYSYNNNNNKAFSPKQVGVNP
jgi:hypothetical protein